MLTDAGYFILGAGMGSALVLTVWQWWEGRKEAKTKYETYTDDLFLDYYKPTETPVEEVIVTRVKKARSKRIKSRKKPVSKTRRQK